MRVLLTLILLILSPAAPVHALSVVQTGDLVITGARALPTLKGASTGIGFMEVHNKGKEDLSIISATTDIAEHTELHKHEMDNDIMRMRQLDAIPIPAGETVTFRPGGLHLMFMSLKKPLADGESFWVELALCNGDVVKRLFHVSKMTPPKPREGLHR